MNRFECCFNIFYIGERKKCEIIVHKISYWDVSMSFLWSKYCQVAYKAVVYNMWFSLFSDFENDGIMSAEALRLQDVILCSMPGTER